MSLRESSSRSERRRVGLGMIAGGLLATWAAGSAHAATVNVNMLEMTFSMNGPGQPVLWPTINVGDTVRWTLVEGIHTTQSVVGSPEQWDSDILLNLGDTFEYTFNSPGVFTYYCLIHGFDAGDGTAGDMWGNVTVVPAPGALAMLGGVGLWASRRRR